MSRPVLPSPQAAPEVFLGLPTADGQGVSDLTAAGAWRHFGAFAEIPFDVPPVPDSDGLLFQYGTWSLTGERLFYFDLVRQFVIPDEDEYLQFHCSLRFAPTRELEALGSYSEWWWPGEGALLSPWLTSIASRPEWSLLTAGRPLSAEVRVDGT